MDAGPGVILDVGVPQLVADNEGQRLGDNSSSLRLWHGLALLFEGLEQSVEKWRDARKSGTATGPCWQPGIPLAIEFAAAHATVLGLAQIDAYPDNRFNFLTSGRRTALPRHRTLRAVLELELRTSARTGTSAAASAGNLSWPI